MNKQKAQFELEKKNLKRELNEERNKYKILNNDYIELKKENNKLKNEIKLLNDKLNMNIQKIKDLEKKNFKKELDEEKEENNKLKNEINLLNDKLNMNIQNIKELETIINSLKMEIPDLISNNANKDIIFNPGDKIMSLNFVSQGSQDIQNYSLVCKDTDLFIKLEERILRDFRKFKNEEIFFRHNTRKILRYKTIAENELKNNDIICIFVNELD